jgi:dCMP deaminase
MGNNKAPYIDSWDEYFLELARTVARKSKDPKCPVGAVIVSSDDLVLATGFNGLARGVNDDKDLLADASEKLRWICHAEENAILNAGRAGISVRGCSIYVTKFPCFACCRAIAQGGVTRIYTDDHKYWDDDPLDGTTNLDGTANPEPHSRKRALLRQVPILVVAENHPEHTTHWRVAHPQHAAAPHPSVHPHPVTPSRHPGGHRKPLAKTPARTPAYLRKHRA